MRIIRRSVVMYQERSKFVILEGDVVRKNHEDVIDIIEATEGIEFVSLMQKALASYVGKRVYIKMSIETVED